MKAPVLFRMADFTTLKPKLRKLMVRQNLVVPGLFFLWGFPCTEGLPNVLFRLCCLVFFGGNLAGSMLTEKSSCVMAFRTGMIANSVASWIVSAWWCFGLTEWLTLMVLEHAFQVVGILLFCGSRCFEHVAFTFVGSVIGYMLRPEADTFDFVCKENCWFMRAAITVLSLVGGMVLIGILNFDALRRKIEALWFVMTAPTANFEDDALQAVLKRSAETYAGDSGTGTSLATSKTQGHSGENVPVASFPLSNVSSGSGERNGGSAASPFADIIVERQIGRGSFGRVFKGTCDGTDVAVKVVEWQYFSNQVTKQKFLPEFEARLGADLQHHHLVRTIKSTTWQVGDVKETWIVQEWCDLGTLGDFCIPPKSAREAVEICLNICAGGAYLHDKSIVHGDLTANNVLVCSSSSPKGYDCKIGDFGLARVLEGERPYLVTTQLGTVSHMPPELFNIVGTIKFSKKVDIYSLGMLLYQTVTGTRPFSWLAPTQIVVQVSKGTRINLPEHIPQSLVDIYEKCVATVPDDRPEFDEVSRELSALAIDG